jgi:hypothetical protein
MLQMRGRLRAFERAGHGGGHGGQHGGGHGQYPEPQVRPGLTGAGADGWAGGPLDEVWGREEERPGAQALAAAVRDLTRALDHETQGQGKGQAQAASRRGGGNGGGRGTQNGDGGSGAGGGGASSVPPPAATSSEHALVVGRLGSLLVEADVRRWEAEEAVRLAEWENRDLKGRLAGDM